MSGKLVFTPLDDIEKVRIIDNNGIFWLINEQIYTELKATFASGKSRPNSYRKYQLLQLAYMVKDNVKLFEDALAADLGRPQTEARM